MPHPYVKQCGEEDLSALKRPLQQKIKRESSLLPLKCPLQPQITSGSPICLYNTPQHQQLMWAEFVFVSKTPPFNLKYYSAYSLQFLYEEYFNVLSEQGCMANNKTIVLIKSPGEALSTWASRGPKGKQEVWVAKRLSYCPKILQNRKMPEKWFLSPIWSKMTPQISQNDQHFDP